MAEQHNIEVVLDRNLHVETSIKKDDITFLNPRKAPFCIYGLYDPLSEDEYEYKRLPDEVAKRANDAVRTTYKNTSGGRIRFSTNSAYVAIKVEWDAVTVRRNIPTTGTAGIDMFVDSADYPTSKFYKTFVPPYYWTCKEGYESVLDLPDRSTKYITINLPLYNNLKNIYIGLQNDATIGAGKPYRFAKPVVFYGGTAVQGACVCRPGNAYPAILSRRLDMDFINLGFFEETHGDTAVADYISSLDASAIVCDLGPYADDADHKKIYDKIRAFRPTLPFVMVSRASAFPAVKDENMYFVDADEIYNSGAYAECYTADGTNLSDSGAVRMAEVLEATFRRIINSGNLSGEEM